MSTNPERGTSTARLAADPEYGDADSNIDDGESIDLSTSSVNSTIFNFRKVHGRTFQNFKDDDLWHPNDDKHNEALDIHHHMMLLIHDNKLHLSPLKDPQKVIDIGTGTGIWAIDFADQFPSAEVIGTDLSPIQPSWIPPNLKFELDDASQDWTYKDNTFDFIHLRFLIGSIEDWPKLYREAYRCLKPGGWLEHTDFTIRILWDEKARVPEDSGFVTWNKMFAEVSVKTGRTFLVTDKGQNGEWMKQGGFPGPIHEREFQLPLGAWPAEKKWKEIGAFNLLSCEQGLEGYGLYLGTQVLGWSLEEMQVLFAKMRSDMKNRKYHAYYPCATRWTQKPLS